MNRGLDSQRFIRGGRGRLPWSFCLPSADTQSLLYGLAASKNFSATGGRRADKASGEDLVEPVADEDGRAEELVRIIRDPSAKLLDGPVLLLDGDVARPERLDGLV